MDEFTGKSLPLDTEGLQGTLDLLGASAAQLWAVVRIETSGCGYLADRRPKVLYERHVFSRLTKGKFDAKHPSLSNPSPGGYGDGGAAQYKRLSDAIALDRKAALESCSWGIGQVMGFNAQKAGFASLDQMIARMCESEVAQFHAIGQFIKAAKLDGALRSGDWKRFARGYNGDNYAINSYDTRLEAAYRYARHGGMPDLSIRAAQVYLTFLKFDPYGIDGVLGNKTRSAMNDYQAAKRLPITASLDEATLAALKADCA